MNVSSVSGQPLNQVELRREWGINQVPWLWGENLKILIVIDGLIDLTSWGFGLGKMVGILRDPAYAWWVDFDVDVAERNATPPPPTPLALRYVGFRFDQAGFDLDEYDQVWLFGFEPGNDAGPDSNIAMRNPLSDAELGILARWMDAGGGVFAAGDHDYLGASMCSRIPRVRTMRKWTNVQGVPPIGGVTRLDTNQPPTWVHAQNLAYMDFDVQGDYEPQPIEVVMDPLWTRIPWLRRSAPHPILCTRKGIIEVFPDHPHEGEIIDDDDVELDSPLGIAGYTGVEYPGGAGRPTPRVIAYGRTTHKQTNRIKGPVEARRFGLVGVYDGDPVNIGRVVVDSTWHHWFSENLVGFEDFNIPVYETMKSYFRNVALWLATPTQRANMLAAATWGVVVGTGPMVFPPKTPIFELGERARDVIGRTATQCTISEWVGVFLDLELLEAIKLPPDIPCLTCPPWERFEHAILGGMASKLVDVAFPMQEKMSRGAHRPPPDPRAIAAAATQGARLGHRELVRGLADGGRIATQISRATAKGFRRQPIEAPDMSVMDVRVVVDQVRITDPNDPALDHNSLNLVARVSFGDQVIAERAVDAEVPEFGPRGTVVSLNKELAELTVWRGADLTIEVSTAIKQREPTVARGSITLHDNPQDWLGAHLSPTNPANPWCLKVSIDQAGTRTARRRRS